MNNRAPILRKIKIITIFILSILGINSYAGTIDSLLKQSVPDCNNIALNAMKLIPDYYQKGSIDSVNMVIEAWKSNCGQNSIDRRLIILFSIASGSFNDSLIDSLFFQDPERYQNRYKHYTNNESEFNIGSDYPESPYFNILKKYWVFITKLAESLLEKQEKYSSERLLCLYYSGNFDDFFYELKSDSAFKKSKLFSLYNVKINSYLKISEGHFAFFAGNWMPTGKAKVLGCHPNFGITFGRKYRKITGDLFLSFKFLNAPNNYLVKQNDSIYSVNHFFGGHFGLDLGYEVVRNPSFEIDIYSGIGADGFDALTQELSAQEKAISIFALNINPGAEFRYYYGKNKLGYLGIRFRYNFVDYNKAEEIVTDLSGSIYSLDFLWGFSGSFWRNTNLRALRFY